MDKYNNKKVIVIDDDKLNLRIAAKIVSEYVEDLDQAESGYELIEKVNSGSTYDLIITDDMMPGKSGTETMRYLKNDLGIKIPIVVLTGNTVDGAKEHYLNAGFDYYLEKPINREEVAKVIYMYLR